MLCKIDNIQTAIHPAFRMRLFRRDKRQNTRYPANAQAKIKAIDGVQTTVSDGIVCDVSRSGLGLTTKQFFMWGTTVEVRYENKVVRGRVQHCRELKDKLYGVGVEIVETGTPDD